MTKHCETCTCSSAGASADQAEIATITVKDDKIVDAVMKSPGLPDGSHDLFCVPFPADMAPLPFREEITLQCESAMQRGDYRGAVLAIYGICNRATSPGEPSGEFDGLPLSARQKAAIERACDTALLRDLVPEPSGQHEVLARECDRYAAHLTNRKAMLDAADLFARCAIALRGLSGEPVAKPNPCRNECSLISLDDDHWKCNHCDAVFAYTGAQKPVEKPRCWWPLCKETAGDALCDAVQSALTKGEKP